MRGHNTYSRPGLALLIVVGVLGILAVLAAAFVTMAQLERRASRQRLDATKAMLLARAGIEDALARLGAGQDPDLPETRYAGEDWDADGALDGIEATDEAYGVGRLNVWDCPARQAMRPSFFARDGSGTPALERVDGRRRGSSGMLAGDQAPDGGTYALKVSRGGLTVNGGDPSVPVNATVPDYNRNLRRMLGILAEAIDREDGVAGDGPVARVDGERLIDLRPSAGWRDWSQVRDIALGGGQGKLDALRPYLTLQTQVDKKVIRPNVVGGMEGQAYPSWAEIKLAHETYPGMPGTKEPDFERVPVLPPSMGGKLVGRAPVDLAWARTRRPVLIALLANLKGLYLDELAATPMLFGDAIGTLQAAEIALSWTSGVDDCRFAADRILASTSELSTWDQWDAFCDGLFMDQVAAVQAAIAAAQAVLAAAQAARDAALAAYNANPTIPNWNAYLAADDAAKAAGLALAPLQAALAPAQNLAQAKRDILKANFNPNSRLNKFSPNLSLWKRVDKSGLLVYSTEFSLLPMASARSVESAGRILGKDGRLLASRALGVSIAPAGLLTLSTQKEFVCEDLGDPLVAGDEAAFRQPGQAPFISQGAGTGRTWGHRLDDSTAHPASWLDGDSRGASLQTFPEPCVVAGAAGTGLSTRAAGYDGSIQLATVETPENECYAVTAPPKDMKLLVRYTGDLDLDVSDAVPTRPASDQRWRNQPDWQQVTYVSGLPGDPSQLAYGLLHPTRPNTLYPDGAYSEKDRAPSYLDRGNAHGIHGLISFWIKSNHDAPGLATVRGHPFLKWTHFSLGVPDAFSPDQFFFLGDYSVGACGSAACGISCFFETDHSTGVETLMEHGFQRALGLTPHQWSLVTMYYDFRSPDLHDCGELRVNAGLAGVDQGSDDFYDLSTGNDPASASDITLPDIFGDHRLVLGKGRPEIEFGEGYFAGSGADATLDELAIYDFGGATYVSGISIPAPNATLESPGVLAANRFQEGRHYKESFYKKLGHPANRAGEYFSPPITLGACRIRALAWTQVLPRGLRSPLPPPPLDQPGVDGDPGPDGAILLELTNDQGNDYLKDSSGKPIDQSFECPASSRVERRVDKPFRLHAVFQPNLADKDNTPILDPLALDDVTVVYEPLGGRRLLSWE